MRAGRPPTASRQNEEAVKGFERTTLSAVREKIAHGNAERLLRD
ncbi:hypothetical protein [Mycobacterium sp. 852002-51057_SCH5723018]|nr:hypothetical protein [Mycobacterium sp. 852002-51057_SCH5723018]